MSYLARAYFDILCQQMDILCQQMDIFFLAGGETRLYLHGAVFAALPSWGSTRSPRDHEPSFLIQQGVSLLIIEAKSNPLSTNSTVNAHTHYRQSGNSRQTTMHEAMHTNQHPFTAQRQHKIFPIHHLIEHKFTFLDLTKCILGLTFKS